MPEAAVPKSHLGDNRVAAEHIRDKGTLNSVPRNHLSGTRIVGMIALALVTASFPAFGQADSLTLAPGAPPTVNLTSPSGSQPSTLQWTLTYPASQVVSISASAGAAAANASKTLSCSSAAGAYSCVVSGMNAGTISNGAVAVLDLSLAAGVSSRSGQSPWWRA